jgi:predicted transcriptional regulator
MKNSPRKKSAFGGWHELKRSTLSAQARARVDAAVKRDLLEMDLKELRDMANVPQVQVATALETTQSQISRIEARDDHLVSTLREYVKALGGELEVIARFGDRTIRLKGV